MKWPTILSVTLVLTAALYAQNRPAQDFVRWSLPEGAVLRLGKGDTRLVVWSPDGTRLAVGGNVGIWLYDARTGAEVSLLIGHTSRVSCMVFTRDGMTLASGSHDNTVRLWDVTTGQEKSNMTGHTDWVNSVAFSPDEMTLASGSNDHSGLVGGVFAGRKNVGKHQLRRYDSTVGCLVT